MKLIIVGGVAGGASAAARARRLSESAEIVVFERGPEVSFANCGLPYFVGGEIAEREKLIVVSPELLRKRFRLDVRVLTSIEKIDRKSKTVLARDLVTGRVYEETYDKLILAPGASPIRPSITGIDLPDVFTLRSLRDADRIRERVDRGVKRVVVVGGGFIGLEMVENLVRRGISTTLVQSQDQILSPFDKEMTSTLLEHLTEHGVEVILGDPAEGFAETLDGLEAQLRSGRRPTGDLVILGIGVKPESRLAVDAGLDVDSRGGIRVNDHLQTNDPDIYAVGDAIEVQDFVLGSPTLVPLAGPANRQGRIAADHVFGRDSRYRGTQGTAVVGVFEMTAAMTGASEKSLRQAGRTFRKVYVHPANHASYFPGAEPMILKILFAPEDGRLLGAQGVGRTGVDKRIDVLAMSIQAGMTVFDLEEAELAYAPQYGSAKDPVNMAGFVAAGLLRNDHPQIDVETVLAPQPDLNLFILDVRTTAEFTQGHIVDAVNIPIDELRDRLGEIPRDRKIATYCQVGQRGYLATRILRQAGFDAVNIGGGYATYRLHRPLTGASA